LPELEESLRHVAGITAVSVVTGPDAIPIEIHVVADRSKGAKQVVRDVQSLALAAHGLDIDHRIVSVVQFDDAQSRQVIRLPEVPDTPAPGTELAARPTIASISVRTASAEADASVVVAAGGVTYEGRSIGPSTMGHRHMLVARATLDALGELLGLPAEVEFATVLPMGSREMAACLIDIAVPRIGELALTGSALVRNDETDAVARAVLDALNRRLAG
jgi:hypothetical protein